MNNLPRTRFLTIVAQDPSVKKDNKIVLLLIDLDFLQIFMLKTIKTDIKKIIHK